VAGFRSAGVYHAFSTGLWPVPLAIVVYLMTAVGGSLYAGHPAVHRSPNEQAAETPYMLHNIEATRRAFNLDTVQTRDLSGDAELTKTTLCERRHHQERPLWDHQPLLDTFGQIQELRTYYDFVSVDNDRYTIKGESDSDAVGARADSEILPNRTWINEHLTFTHGYGLTLGPVNEVTQEACRCCS